MQQAEEVSAQLADTLKALPDGLLTLDASMTITSANLTAEALFGGNEVDSVVGHNAAEIFYEHEPGRKLENGRLPAISLSMVQ